jgi:hypothetical protein
MAMIARCPPAVKDGLEPILECQPVDDETADEMDQGHAVLGPSLKAHRQRAEAHVAGGAGAGLLGHSLRTTPYL